MAEINFNKLKNQLKLPLIAAPMFLVSGPELVIASSIGGIIGSFPTANCRTTEELDSWLIEITTRLAEHEQLTGFPSAPICPNLIVHKSNTRLRDDLEVLKTHRPFLVITSVGSPSPVLAPLHDIGALVFADVASLQHAQKAVAAGVDGLVLLTAGAGGQTGWLNPFAFVREVRTFFDGPIVLAGGLSDGHALYAAEVLGCDLGYMGTKFIATNESMASDAYKAMLVQCNSDDILLTNAITGLEANMLRPSIINAGLNPNNLPAHNGLNISRDLDAKTRQLKSKRWKEIWSAGHSISGVLATYAVSDLIAQTEREYRSARSLAISSINTPIPQDI